MLWGGAGDGVDGAVADDGCWCGHGSTTVDSAVAEEDCGLGHGLAFDQLYPIDATFQNIFCDDVKRGHKEGFRNAFSSKQC